MGARKTHYRNTRSERKRAAAAHARAQARKHKHICEGCANDEPYVCTAAPCQHLEKKLCKSCRWQSRYRGTVSATPLMDFKEPPTSVFVGSPVIGECADFYPILMMPHGEFVETMALDAIEGNLEVIDILKNHPKPGKVYKKLCNLKTCFAGDCSDACDCECHDDPNPSGL